MKLKTKNVVMKNDIKIKSKLNQNIGMNVSIAVVNIVQKIARRTIGAKGCKPNKAISRF